jgi:hypothetical protein
MSQTQFEVEGTLRADGTLLLDEKPNLPPGRVHVTVQPVVQLPAEDPFWQRMQDIWDSQKAAGRRPRTKEQIDAELRTLDDDAEAEMQATERLQEEFRQVRQGTSDPGSPPQ